LRFGVLRFGVLRFGVLRFGARAMPNVGTLAAAVDHRGLLMTLLATARGLTHLPESRNDDHLGPGPIVAARCGRILGRRTEPGPRASLRPSRPT